MVYTITVHLYVKDDPTAIEKVRLKLIEASRVYRKDKETIDWFVMQDAKDPRACKSFSRSQADSCICGEGVTSGQRGSRQTASPNPTTNKCEYFGFVKCNFTNSEYPVTIVERYENEGSQKYHLENPYWKTFDPYVVPLLDRSMDLRRFEELDTSQDVVVPAP